MAAKTQIGVKVDTDTWKAVRMKSIQEDVTAGEIVNAAIRQYLGMDAKEPAPRKRQAAAQTSTGSDPAEVEAVILKHEEKTAREMADFLNETGYTTVKGGAFNMNVVGKIRTKMKQEGKR